MRRNRVLLILAVLLIMLLLAVSCRGRGNSGSPSAPDAAQASAETSTDGDAESEGSSSSSAPGTTPGQSAGEASTAAESSRADNASIPPTPTPLDEENTIITSTGLQYTEEVAGSGKRPEPGDVVAVHYTGTLEDGTVFDSSHNRGEPIRFPLGTGSVIAGWDEGIARMAEGGKAVLVIPPDLAYGESGAGGVIPPNATLIFDVELVEVTEGAPAAPTTVAESDYETTEEGLKFFDFVVGEGPSPQPGQEVLVDYTGWLMDGGKFDSSIDRGQPFRFNIGTGRVIPGWDIGVATMKVGGKRQIVVPPELGYGAAGAGGGVIPPNATLVFEIELLEVK